MSARLYFNKIVYAFVRRTRSVPVEGWLHSRWYWFHYPLPLRGQILWSQPLRAWFCPEDETALEYMIHLSTYEPVQWVRPQEGEVFIDVGGYVGSYSISAARAVGSTGHVVTLEPDSKNRRQLERNLALNEITNCEVLPVAAWSASGTIGWHQDSHPVFHKVEKSDGSRTIEAVCIDDLVQRLSLKRVDWIKMDIEGVEVDALEGAADTLARFRPQLFIEIHETLRPVLDFLSRSGYTIVDSTFDRPPDHHGWILARASPRGPVEWMGPRHDSRRNLCSDQWGNPFSVQTRLTNGSKAIAGHDDPQVSVIIPTYLRPETLLKCVESILTGARRPAEIVIVGRAGDRGTEDAITAIKMAAHADVRIHSVSVAERGHIPPVETGVRRASGELVATLDDDVTVTPEWLSSIVSHFSDPTIGVVGGRVLVPGAPLPKLKGRPGCVSWYGKAWGNIGSLDVTSVVEVDSVMECNWVWRRELLASLEFDPALNFDDASMYGLDLCLQAKKRGFKVLYDRRALVYHHAAPRAPELDRQKRGPRSFSYCRNYTYIMLKRLPIWRRGVFLAWWFLIGERGAWGLGSLLADTLRAGWRKERNVAQAWRGKMEGIRLRLLG